MKYLCLSGLCLSILFLSGAFAQDANSLPGDELTMEEAEEIRAAVTIKGTCVQGAACTATLALVCAVTPDGAGCVSTAACGSCNGAKDVTCTANAAQPYSCETALPLAFCCNITTKCRWGRNADGSPHCNCKNVAGVNIAQVTRVVC